MKTEVFKYSRLRKDSAVHVSLSSSSLVKQPGIAGIPSFHFWKVPEAPHPTTNNNRLLSAVDSLIVMRSFTGAKRCLGLRGQCIAALSGRVIGPPDRGCQRPSSTNCRIASQEFWDAKKSLCFGPLAALEPQSCDVLTITYALNRRMPVGAAGVHLPGTGDLDEPVAFPMRPRKLREICTPLTFEILAGLLLASDSRISMRAARHAPESPFKRAETWVWIGRGLVGC